MCDICNSWIHPNDSNDSWFCFKCTCKKFPFGNLNNQNFHSFTHNNSEINESSVGKYSNGNNTLKLNPAPSLKLLFNQFNKLTAESNKKNPENSVNCRNLDIDEIQKMKIEANSLSLYHINSCSLNENFEDLEYFDIISISESRILKDTNLSKNINIYNCSVEFTPTESHAGGTLLYINNELSYKLRQDLCIYKSSDLESTFIEIINQKNIYILSLVVYIYIQQ